MGTSTQEENIVVASKPAIFEKILAIQTEVGKIPKNGKMDFKGVKYDYVKNDDILEAVAGLLNSNGVITKPRIIQNITEFRELGAGRVMPIVKVELMLTYIAVEDGSEFEVGPFWGEGAASDDKGLRKAVTAAQKIANLLTFTIVTGDMADPDSFYTQPLEANTVQNPSRAEVGVSAAKAPGKPTLESTRLEIKKLMGSKKISASDVNALAASANLSAEWFNDFPTAQKVLELVKDQG